MLINKFFKKHKNNKNPSSSINNKQLIDKDFVYFNDYNDIKISINIRVSDGIPYLFIGNSKNKFEFAFDRDSAMLLVALLNAYIYNGDLSQIESILKGENNEEK